MDPIDNTTFLNSQLNQDALKPKFSYRFIVFIVVMATLMIGTASFFILNKKNSSSGNIAQQNDVVIAPSITPTKVPPTQAIPIPSSIEPTGAQPESQWYIQLTENPWLTDLSYYILPSPTTMPNSMPIIGSRPPTISGNIFAPLKAADYYCTFYEDEREGATLEVKNKDSWITANICPTQPQDIRASTLFCRQYMTELGVFTYLYVYKDEKCDSSPIENGTYRLKYELYTTCTLSNIDEASKKSNNVDPSSCKEKHILYSPEFTIQ